MRFRTIALSAVAVSLIASCSAPPAPVEQPKNLVFFIADGCGPATYSLGREYIAETQGRRLVFDDIEVGSVNTRSSNSRVTDSAASATAYACAIRTKNGMIGVNPDSEAVATILEAAEEKGMWTGLVTTARISHATPAAFSSHVPSRNQESDIALQQLEQGIELLLGGGSTFYAGPEERTSRDDGRNLFEEAKEKGYTVARTSGELMAAESVPLLGLFDPTHMDYEIDRSDPEEGEVEQPSLAEMTRRALDLFADAPQGFFLMIEAGRIDHAGHANDIGAQLWDFVAYEAAVAEALEFAGQNGQTLVIATSDHETGGLSLGADGVYDFYPDVISAMSWSRERALDRIGDVVASGASGDDLTASFNGIVESRNLMTLAEETNEAVAAISKATRLAADPVIFARTQLDGLLIEGSAKAAGIGWSTSGHTGVNVPLFASGPGSEAFGGVMDNMELGLMLWRSLGLDPQAASPRMPQ